MPPKVPPKRRTLADALAAVDRMAIGADNTRTPGYRPPPVPTVAPTPERVRLSPRGGLLAQAVRGQSLGDTPLGLVNELVNPVRQGVQTREMANAVAAQARKATRTGLLGDALAAGGMGGLTLATALPGMPHAERVPVSALGRYREFIRTPSPELIADIQKNGIREPLILEYSVADHGVRLTEGNNRLAVAEALGMTDVPVTVIRREGSFPRRLGANSPIGPRPPVSLSGPRPDIRLPERFAPSTIGVIHPYSTP